jgi:hypothetical protein
MSVIYKPPKGGGLGPLWAVAPQERKGKERKGKQFRLIMAFCTSAETCCALKLCNNIKLSFDRQPSSLYMVIYKTSILIGVKWGISEARNLLTWESYRNTSLIFQWHSESYVRNFLLIVISVWMLKTATVRTHKKLFQCELLICK